jgi:hypothetical protein
MRSPVLLPSGPLGTVCYYLDQVQLHLLLPVILAMQTFMYGQTRHPGIPESFSFRFVFNIQLLPFGAAP